MEMWAALKKDYGEKFCALCVLNYGGVKGLLNRIAFSGMVPYLQNHLKVDSKKYSDIYTIARSPWGAKGLWAMLSDTTPLLYYHKKYYILFGSIIGTGSLVLLASADFTADQVNLAGMCLFLTFMFIAMSDILIQGRYGQIMSQFGGTVSILTLVWGTVHLGGLIGSLLVGPLADRFQAEGRIPDIFWLGVPFSIMMIFPMLLNWIGEMPTNSCKPDCDMWSNQENKGPLLLAMVQSFLAVSIGFFLTAVNDVTVKEWGWDQALIMDEPDVHLWLQLSYCLSVSVGLIIFSYRVLPRTIANCNFYMYLVELVSLSVQSLQYYYRASPLCVPDAPYFDNTYWLTFVPICESVVSLLGVGVFEMYMKGWNARQAFWVTTAIKCFASLVDNFIILRWNVAIGLPDSLTYFIGGATIVSLVETLDFLPSNVIIGKLCPKSIESTVYAILAGFSNMGSNVAVIEGKVLQAFLGVKMVEPQMAKGYEDCMNDFRQGLQGNFFGRPEEFTGLDRDEVHKYLFEGSSPRCVLEEPNTLPDCDTSNLSLLVFCSQFIGPLLSIPLTFVLIPNVKLDGDFLNVSNETELASTTSARDIQGQFLEGKNEDQQGMTRSATSALDAIAIAATEATDGERSMGTRYSRLLSTASLAGGPRQGYQL